MGDSSSAYGAKAVPLAAFLIAGDGGVTFK
jgi:hypothetical protein